MNTTHSTVQCPHCKQNNPPTQTHCDFCGQRLSSTAPPPNAQVTTNTVTPLPVSAPVPAPLSHPAPRNRLLIGVALAMALIVTAAVSIKIFTSSKSEAPVTEPTNVVIKREPTAPPASTAPSTSGQPDIATSSDPQVPAVPTTDVKMFLL